MSESIASIVIFDMPVDSKVSQQRKCKYYTKQLVIDYGVRDSLIKDIKIPKT